MRLNSKLPSFSILEGLAQLPPSSLPRHRLALLSTSKTPSPPLKSSQESESGRQFPARLDYAHILENNEGIAQNAKQRASPIVHQIPTIVNSIKALNQLKYEHQVLCQERNAVAKEVQRTLVNIKKTKEQSAPLEIKADKSMLDELVRRGKEIKLQIQGLERDISIRSAQTYDLAKQIPNTTSAGTPIGSEDHAVVIDVKKSANSPFIPPDIIPNQPPNPQSDLQPKSHVDLLESLDMIDLDRSGKVSGSSFYYLKNMGALLEMALIRYAMDICMREGHFLPILPPDLIRHEVMEACGFSPRGDEDMTYSLEGQGVGLQQLCLAATAEFPLAGYHATETLSHQSLPIQYVGLGRAFRAEGQAGAINRGLYRVHQFTKLEMFAICEPHQSEDLFGRIIRLQKRIFTGLDLTYRVLNMPTEELGSPAHCKYDMEAWMPGKGAWGEISSTSQCTDYQSRRLGIRFHPKHSTTPQYTHTLNGTACAVPRMIIALVEQHQRPDGSVYIPKALRPYLYDVDLLVPGKSIADYLYSSGNRN